MHLALLDQIYPLIPEGAQITFLGDGEFDGVGASFIRLTERTRISAHSISMR